MKSSSTSTPSHTQGQIHKNSPRLNPPTHQSPATQAKSRRFGALSGTPDNSPPESPSRSQSQQKRSPDLQLALSRVIGTTATSPASLDSISSGNKFAFTAGAAAVLVTVGPEPHYKLTQRFFRARSTTVPLNSLSGPNVLSSISAKDARGNYSPFGSAAAGMSSPFSTGHASEWANSPGGKNKSWSSKERIKAASAVSLSSDGKFLAVGETGYKPRVLIFSVSETNPMSDTPLTALAEHTFGVCAVAFSPDSRYLASLGATNDGFLYIWAINGKNGMATLHACNKCTSPVQQITWMGNNRFLTVGVRHVKIWRIDESDASLPNNVGPSTPKSATSKPRVSDVNGAHAQNSPVHYNKYHHRHKTLYGRNCLLGSLLEATFTSVAAISDDKAIVCTTSGDVCLLDDSDGSQKFHKIMNIGHGITSCTFNSGKDSFHIAGDKGEFRTFAISRLLDTCNDTTSIEASVIEMPSQTFSSVSVNAQTESNNTPNVHSYSVRYNALAPINGLIVAINAHRSIQLLNISTDLSTQAVSDWSILQQLLAHKDCVLGVRTLDIKDHLQATFYTWSADGSVLFWSSHGSCMTNIEVDLEQSATNGFTSLSNGGASIDDCDVNELRAVNVTAEQEHLLSGDKLGILKVTNMKSGLCESEFRAHSAEITDIAVHNGSNMLLAASAGRDRTVQVFYQYKYANESNKANPWQLLQTLEEHVGAVTGVMFSTDGKRLISRSSDRTVVIREFLISNAIIGEETSDSDRRGNDLISGFLLMRTIMLKASPVAMTLQYEQEKVAAKGQTEYLWISTIDRHLHRYNIESGQLMCSFKTADSESGDAVIMSSLLHMEMPSATNPSCLVTVLAGVSSTDKSVRLYDESGKLICRDWGHTEGVSAIAFIKSAAKNDNCDIDEKDLQNREITETELNITKYPQNLVTVAVDGTIFVWGLEPINWYTQSRGIRAKSVDHPNSNVINPTEPYSRGIPCSKMPPLRRILSQSELARLQRSPARIDMNNLPVRAEKENMQEDEAEESANSIKTRSTVESVHSSITSTSSSSPILCTPTRQRAQSPGLRKKKSRLSVAPTPRLEPQTNQSPVKAMANASREYEVNHNSDASKFSRKGANRRRASVATAVVNRRSPSPAPLVHTTPQSPISPKGRRLTQNHQKHKQNREDKGRRMSVHAWSKGNDKNAPVDATDCWDNPSNSYCRAISAQAEELCSNLRAYRDKLASSRLRAQSSNRGTESNSKENAKSCTSPSTEKVRSELELTLQAISLENSQIAPSNTPDTSTGSTDDSNVAFGSSRKSSGTCDADMEKLLDRYSERLVGMLDMRLAKGVSVSSATGPTLKVRESQTSGPTALNDSSNSRTSGLSQHSIDDDVKPSGGVINTAH